MVVEGFVRDLYNKGIDPWDVSATWLFMCEIEELYLIVENLLLKLE